MSGRGLPVADAPDVVQEIFIRLVRALPTFTLVQEKGRFRTWLYQVTMHVVIDYVRRKTTQGGRVKEWWERFGKTITVAEEPDDDWNQGLQRRALEYAQLQVQGQTNPRTWSCYEQRYLKGRSCADIAAELDLTANAVGVNANRVFERVCAMLRNIWKSMRRSERL